MIDIFKTAHELQALCSRQGWRSCFIGGVALQRWGEPRVTRDVDLTLLTGFGTEEQYIDVLLGHYKSRIDDAKRFALQRRVLLLTSVEGVGVDVSLGALPFEERVVNRATGFSYAPGLELRTCSAEDLIVLKLFASRPRDLLDVEGVVTRLGIQLDWSYIEDQLGPLAELKEEPEIMDKLARLRRSARR